MTTELQVSAQKELQRIVDQIERLDEERKALGGDIREKFTEAKSKGFDGKILRKVLALRKKSQTDRQEEEAMIATYCHALGMGGTPLGSWAEKKTAEKAAA